MPPLFFSTVVFFNSYSARALIHARTLRHTERDVQTHTCLIVDAVYVWFCATCWRRGALRLRAITLLCHSCVLVTTRRLVSDYAHAFTRVPDSDRSCALRSESKSSSSSAVYITPTGLPPPSVGRGTYGSVFVDHGSCKKYIVCNLCIQAIPWQIFGISAGWFWVKLSLWSKLLPNLLAINCWKEVESWERHEVSLTRIF